MSVTGAQMESFDILNDRRNHLYENANAVFVTYSHEKKQKALDYCMSFLAVLERAPQHEKQLAQIGALLLVDGMAKLECSP